MKELKCFIEDLQSLGFEMVSVGEVFCDEYELISIDDLLDRIKIIGVKEVVAEYLDSFEFVDNNGKYIEISGVC